MKNIRERLPVTRRSLIHRVKIRSEGEPLKLFLVLGFYDDGRPGELFIHADQSGSCLDGFCDAWATAISVCLQHGEPWQNIVAKYSFLRFEPAGMTDNPAIPMAHSVPDYVVRWIQTVMAERKELAPC